MTTRRCKTPQLALLLWALTSTTTTTTTGESIPEEAPPRRNRNSVLEALWNTVHPPPSRSITTTTKTTESSSRPRRTRRATRRRALYEHTLRTHYVTKSTRMGEDIKASGTYYDEGDSWIAAGGGDCVYYNEGRNSHWTFEWCSLSAKTLRQSHWKPRQTRHGTVEWKIQKEVRLGRHVSSPIFPWNEEALESEAAAEYYEDGDICTDTTSRPGPRTLARRALLLINVEQCRPLSSDTRRIVAVTEPSPCHYVLYVCDGTTTESETVSTKEEQHLNQTTIEQPTKPDQGVQTLLDAYLYATGIDIALPEKADRSTSMHIGLPTFPPSRKAHNLQLIRDMFTHAYDSYMYHAFPASEIQPLTCTPGTFHLVRLPALTLLDSLDTLIVMRNFTEFARSVERLRSYHDSVDGGLFGVPQNVSLFETSIRVLGGLLSAHQLAEAFVQQDSVLKEQVWDEDGTILIGRERSPLATPVSEKTCKWEASSCPFRLLDYVSPSPCAMSLIEADLHPCDSPCTNSTEESSTTTPESCWQYDGLLLDLALDLGQRLLPAFDTHTGIPYGTVNLLNGIPKGETTVASLAGGGTLTLEMELLSRLTGDESFGKAAKLASRALWMRRSPSLHLLGKHIEIQKGEWTESLSGIGSNSDSFYEYLIKHYILFPDDDDFWTMFVAVYNGVHNDTRQGEWYADVDMNLGIKTGVARRVFESLMAFYPGMQVLLGELGPAARTLNSFFMVRELLGFLPERFNFGTWKVDGGPSGAGRHPLRPELLESCYFLHRATKSRGAGHSSVNATGDSSGWLWAADYALHTLHALTGAKCGYGTVKDVSPTTTGAIPGDAYFSTRKSSVRLANEMPSFFLTETLKYLYLLYDDANLLHTDDDHEWVFTTEAHPIHYSPKKVSTSSRDSILTEEAVGDKVELDDMKTKLIERLERRRAKKGKDDLKRPLALTSNMRNLTYEKWGSVSPMMLYTNSIRHTESDVLVQKQMRYLNRHVTPIEGYLIQPFISPQLGDNGDIDRLSNDLNFASLSLGSNAIMGDGVSLQKSCPNYQSSSLDWIRALNGGAVDYSDIYVSSLSDDVLPNAMGTVSAPLALAHHGSGVYLGRDTEHVSDLCLVDGERAKDTNSPTDTESNTAAIDGNGRSAEGMQRYDMGGDIGQFDVSLFTEGTGFLVKHVQSGETIAVTIVTDDGQDDSPEAGDSFEGTITPINPYVMVSSTRPDTERKREVGEATSLWSFTGTNWNSFFSRKPGQNKAGLGGVFQPNKRNVVVTDATNDAFRCEVQLIARTSSDQQVQEGWFDNKSEIHEKDVEVLLTSYPCAPALFGPTLLSRLTESGGVKVTGTIGPLNASDELGCERSGEQYHEHVTISVVRRGQCTFQSKALNLRNKAKSDVVIIINTADDDLFLMSNGGQQLDDEWSEIERNGGGETPVTVLVTGKDGEGILALIEEHTQMEQGRSTVRLIARVQMRAQEGQLDATGNIISASGSIDWPVIRASPDIVQIFAEGGWGVHAISRAALNNGGSANTESRPANTDWQLFLLRHNQKSE